MQKEEEGNSHIHKIDSHDRLVPLEDHPRLTTSLAEDSFYNFQIYSQDKERRSPEKLKAKDKREIINRLLTDKNPSILKKFKKSLITFNQIDRTDLVNKIKANWENINTNGCRSSNNLVEGKCKGLDHNKGDLTKYCLVTFGQLIKDRGKLIAYYDRKKDNYYTCDGNFKVYRGQKCYTCSRLSRKISNKLRHNLGSDHSKKTLN